MNKNVDLINQTLIDPEPAGHIYAGDRQLFPKPEKINHPPHYGGDSTHEVIKVIEAWGLDFHLGNVVKYVARADKKSDNPVEDLEKARWYLDRKIALLRAQRVSV